ncbi:MAG: hypothetical protein Q3994_05230 [Prevotella sp.]|nr:hypothetical protein [Prevotella sp.]
MRERLVTIFAIAVAVMGGVHIVATFTPLISGGLEVLPQARQNAMIYMSLMCGALLIVCGLLVSLLHNRVKEHSFLCLPYRIVLITLVVDGIAAVGFMSHNPFAWAVFVLIICLAIVTSYQNRK